jgi:Pentapeptide repeats (8 copies)/Ion channel
MANEEHVRRLMQGVDAWNNWRTLRPDIVVDLSGADLTGANLSGANLSGANLATSNPTLANLAGTNFTRADLTGANFTRADLTGANLTGANCTGANFGLADLTKAILISADLTSASLFKANLTNAILILANLTGATLGDLTGANLSSANLAGANAAAVKWNRRKMHGKYLGIRGLDSCWGNAVFKRAAADQDFLDALQLHWRGTWRIILFWLWGWLTDYGRSLLRVAFFGFVIAMLYGLSYARWPEMLSYHQSPNWFTPFYFSIVTYTTLGFGDVVPATVIGEVIVSTEVILGYVTLGLLLLAIPSFL